MISAPSTSSLSVDHDLSIGIFTLIAPLSVSTFLNTGINAEDVALSLAGTGSGHLAGTGYDDAVRPHGSGGVVEIGISKLVRLTV